MAQAEASPLTKPNTAHQARTPSEFYYIMMGIRDANLYIWLVYTNVRILHVYYCIIPTGYKPYHLINPDNNCDE